jgi:hypothetical protein
MRTTLLLITSLAVAGCQPIKAPAAPEPRVATSVAASFGRTWNATIDAFASRGISIETLDRSSGLIVPAGRTYVPGDAATALRYADCGTNMMGVLNTPGSVKYNVVVRGDSTQSTVQVRGFYQSAGVGETCESKGLFESEAEASIKAKAESRP